MTSAPSRRRLVALCLALIAGLNLLAYAPSLYAPFVFDDFANILDNPAVREAGAGRASLLDLARPTLRSRRPLAYLSFALNVRGFGFDPLYFHLVNLALHVGSAALLFGLALGALPRTRTGRLPASASLLPALAAALFWSLHPMQVQAVTALVQRMTLGAAFFFLLALFLLLQARGRPRPAARAGWALGAAVAALLGALGKEILITLPAVVLLAEPCLFEDPRPLRQRRRWLAMAALFALGYALVALALFPEIRREFAHYSTKMPGPLSARLLTQPRVILVYLSLLLWPDLSRINADPDWILSTNLLHPWTTLPAGLLLAALIAAAILGLRRFPRPAFALLFLLITLFPESGVFPLDLAFDHRLYLPSTALLALSAAAWAWPGPGRGLRLALLAVALLLLGTLTFRRCATWSDDVRLCRDTVKKSPEKSRPWFNLALHLTDVGRYPQAIHAGRRSLALLPCSADAFSNLGGSYLGLRQYDQAEQSFGQALHCDPNYQMAKTGLDLVRTLVANPGLISPFPPPAAAEDPDGAGKLYRRGYSRLREGRYAEAVRDLEAAVKLRPPFGEAASLLEQARQAPKNFPL
jgi:tetratricopeptide (TPR) repeat protein